MQELRSLASNDDLTTARDDEYRPRVEDHEQNLERHGMRIGYQGRSQEFILTEARGLMAIAGPITGVWGRSPQGGPGAEPLVGGSGGRSPLKLKTSELSSIQWKRKNALFSLLCNHNKLGYLRSEPKPSVPLGWGSRGAYPRKQNAFFDLGIGTYNGRCKFWALIRHWSRGRAPVGVQGGLTSPRC